MLSSHRVYFAEALLLYFSFYLPCLVLEVQLVLLSLTQIFYSDRLTCQNLLLF